MFLSIQFLYTLLHARLAAARDDERGMTTTEIVVITALLVTLAFGALAILSATVLDKAESINLEGTGS
jgi:hypothetical protein